MPVLRNVIRFAGSSTTPPPQAITAGSCVEASTSARASIARKPDSPSSSKIWVMLRPSLRAISTSRSTNGTPSRPPSSAPTVDLPEPGIPTR